MYVYWAFYYRIVRGFFICESKYIHITPTRSLEAKTLLYKKEEEKNMKNKKLLGAGLLVVLIAVFAIAYGAFREKPVEGSKSITIEVINEADESKEYEVHTDAEFLRQAMEEAEGLEFSGQESEYGMMVEIVNGESAVYDKDKAYWSFMVNGEMCNNGIDTQPVEDGDEFQIVYTEAE